MLTPNVRRISQTIIADLWSLLARKHCSAATTMKTTTMTTAGTTSIRKISSQRGYIPEAEFAETTDK